ncbi:hypothetical protein TGAM01_v211029 [Trichoderma gamsii]|uniref:Uncharacterized protein n=1 Tax=Trichoderma gamsii TaxID=398673 RepID=A0A2P4Z742_9HYPO|nr:hypothetical protein TGAM01_v211029 [Trichoderma gamsii]PON20106.1 hypothetical protein TGAM01_v211029 [Trichoderma gamsii]
MIQQFCSKLIAAGSASSLAEMFSLRSFGYSVAKTEGPSFILHWSDDDQVVSLGTELTISMVDQFRTLSGYFISEAEAMAQDLLYGLDPVLNIAEIKDNMTNREVGYSFVKHEENGFQMATRQLLAQLSQPYRHQPPLIAHKGWQWSAVKHYLCMVTRLQESIFGGKYTSGGQTPRLRELQWLLCENTAWASRGVYVWNGSVVYIIKHHKAKRMTNKEFYVVRFLPLRLGLVVIKYLAFIHPVAEILRRELHEHMKIRELWRPTHLLFGKNEKPWATSKCTSILQAAAHGVWKQRITSQMYRQIAIGITEKHVREVYTPFNQYDEKSPAADKNVAFAMQSGHKVIQRNTTYGLDGASRIGCSHHCFVLMSGLQPSGMHSSTRQCEEESYPKRRQSYKKRPKTSLLSGAPTGSAYAFCTKGRELYAIKTLCQFWDIQSPDTVELPEVTSCFIFSALEAYFRGRPTFLCFFGMTGVQLRTLGIIKSYLHHSQIFVFFGSILGTYCKGFSKKTSPKASKVSAAAPSPARITTMPSEPATLPSRHSSATPLPPTLSD